MLDRQRKRWRSFLMPRVLQGIDKQYPVYRCGQYMILSLSGNVESGVSAQVRKQILQALRKNESLLVDLSEAGVIGGAIVANLVEGLNVALEKKLTFSLVSPSEKAMKILRLAKLDSMFPIVDIGDRCVA